MNKLTAHGGDMVKLQQPLQIFLVAIRYQPVEIVQNITRMGKYRRVRSSIDN